MGNSSAEYFALFAGLYFQKWDLTTSVLVSTSLFIDTIIVQTVDKRLPSLGPLDWKDWKRIQSPKSMEGPERMEGTDSIAQQVTWHRRWELFPLTELPSGPPILASLYFFILSPTSTYTGSAPALAQWVLSFQAFALLPPDSQLTYCLLSQC